MVTDPGRDALAGLIASARKGGFAGGPTHNVIDFGEPPRAPFLVIHGDIGVEEIRAIRDEVLRRILAASPAQPAPSAPAPTAFTGQMDWPCACTHPKGDHYFGDGLGSDGQMHTWCQRNDGCTDFKPANAPLPTFDPWSDLDTDAQHWAEAFMVIWHDVAPDEGAMLSWFANAIEVTRSAERAALAPALDAERLHEAMARNSVTVYATHPNDVDRTMVYVEDAEHVAREYAALAAQPREGGAGA